MAIATEPTSTDPDLATNDRQWLRTVAGNIRHRLKKLNENRFAVGRMLCAARKRLGGRSGAFGRWIKNELGLPRTQSTRLMRVYRRFGALPSHVTPLFDPTALYSLAEPGVNPEVIRHFTERAMKGNFVRGCEVDQYLAELRDNPEGVDPTTVPKDAPAQIDADRIHAADNWFLLERMIDDGHTLHLSTIIDEGDKLTTAFYIGPSRRPRNVSRRTAEECLLELADEQRSKKCNGPCGLSIPLTDFSKRVKNPDGRNDRCKKCEAERVRIYQAKKKAKRDAKRAAAKRKATPAPSIDPSLSEAAPRPSEPIVPAQ